ncbi:hypothetical protein [Microbacterium sp. USHLN186]|uniref:hypothetical protein n=1 Tax=Microbacterium sp. USHLN186 TaxID=3081286 RepID=UPI00301A7778
MLSEAEGSRRRELQGKAYTAGGGLTDAEARELRDLDAGHSAASASVPPAEERPEQAAMPERPGGAASALPDEPDEPDEPDDPDALDAPVERNAPGEPHETSAPPRRRRLPAVLLSAAVALVLGLGVGWLLFQRGDATPAMTAEQTEVMVELEKTKTFDAGSVVFVGERYGVSAWRATAQDGAQNCLALHVDDRQQHNCMPPPDGEETFPQPVNASIGSADGKWMYWAMIAEDLSGREHVLIQRHGMGVEGDWTSEYTPDELIYAQTLVDRGVEPGSLYIVGYDGQTPVFLSQFDERCVYVVDRESMDVAQACDASQGETLSLTVGDTVYQVQESGNRGPVLTILRTAPSVVCDVDSGYCASVDDKTGEVGG